MTNLIKSVYDNGGETFDRFTVVLNEPYDHTGKLLECLGLSLNPSSPQGFSQFSGCQDGPHLGQKIEFSELPENVQKHVKARLSEGV